MKLPQYEHWVGSSEVVVTGGSPEVHYNRLTLAIAGPRMSMIGQTIAHYRITAKLGEGGMGVVYRADDTDLERQVALKVLPEEMAGDPERLERFRREAKAVAALDHPNIVTLHSVEEADGIHFLTMGLVEGESLEKRLLRGSFPLDLLLDLGSQVADALAAAHGKGIAHRDLKPANVMLNRDGRIKILDFGLAKLVETEPDQEETQLADGLTQEGLAVGTVPYMSPEQLKGEPVDRRTDIFSLGALLHEMATGSRPFQGNSSAELISSILTATPPAVTEINAQLPRHLARIIQRCLEKDPRRRYQSALDVRNELEGLRKEIQSGTLPLGAPVVAASGSAAPASGPPPAPSSVTVTLAAGARRGLWAAAGAVLALALVGAWWLGRVDRTAPPAIRTGDTAASEPAAADARNMTVVLPFENQGSPEDAYFATGMTDEISARLASIDGLGVISRKSAQRYAGSDKTIRQIGDELGVDYVLEGTVRWAKSANAPSRVRITPQLVRVADDSQLWSEVYDREMADVFALQTEIAKAVVAEIDASLLPAVAAMATERPTESLEAYDYYLQGKVLAHGASISQQEGELAAGYLQKATALDPEFALAHAVLAEVHTAHYGRGWDPTEARLEMARRSAERALELQPDLAAAHQAQGVYHYRGSRDYERALAAFERARALEPNNAEVLFWLGVIAKRQGQFEQALGYLERSRQLDPRDARNLIEIGIVHGWLGGHQEAVEWGDRLVALEQNSTRSRYWRARWFLDGTGTTTEMHAVLDGVTEEEFVDDQISMLFFDRDYRGVLETAARFPTDPRSDPTKFVSRTLSAALAYRALGEESAAREQAGEALPVLERLAAEHPYYHSPLATAHAILDRRDAAVAAGERAVELHPLHVDFDGAGHMVYDLAVVHVLLGEPQAALDQLERFLAMPRHWSVARVRNDPIWDPLRDDPRFEGMLNKHQREG